MHLQQLKDILEKSSKKEALDDKDKPFVKNLVKKLRGGSKTHAKQADDLEKALESEAMHGGAKKMADDNMTKKKATADKMAYKKEMGLKKRV